MEKPETITAVSLISILYIERLISFDQIGCNNESKYLRRKAYL